MSVAGSKKGRVFLSDLESEKKKELERRRKLRIQQVRQQSKDLANVIRHKVQSEKENAESRYKKAEKIALQHYHESKLKRLEELYRRCLEDIGDSHIQAAKEPNAELILKAKQAQNAAEALVRGEQAKRRQEEILLEQKIEKEVPIKQKKLARAKEDIRSALVVRLPPARESVRNEPDRLPPTTDDTRTEHSTVRSRSRKPTSSEPTTSVSDTKSNQQKVQILQDIPCNISLKTESEKRITQEPDSKSPSKNTAEPSKSTRDSSKNTGETSKQKINALTSADRWSSGDCDNIDKRTCACSCKCHVDKEDDYSKWRNENKISSDRGYHSDGEYDSSVRDSTRQGAKEHTPCYCRIKYYDRGNHFQTQYKRLNPVTPHHDNTDPVSSAGDILDESAIREKNRRLEENLQKSQERGKVAIRRQLAKQKFQKLLKELSTLEREERIARCKLFLSNVNMGEAQRRAAHEAKQQRMDMAFEKVLYTTAPPRTVIHGDRGNLDYAKVIHATGRNFAGNSPPTTLNVADWKNSALSHSYSQSFQPYYQYSKYPHFAYYTTAPAPGAPQYSPPVHHARDPPIVSHSAASPAPLPPSSPPPTAPPPPPQPSESQEMSTESHEMPPTSPSVEHNNEDQEETLNDIFQRIDHHRKVLLGESGLGKTKDDQKVDLNKSATSVDNKQIPSSPENVKDSENKVVSENKDIVDGDIVVVKSSEMLDNYRRRRKLPRVRLRSETRKKKLSRTKDSEACCKEGVKATSASKFDIRIQSPTTEHYKVDVDVTPSRKGNDNLQAVQKSSVNSVDTEATQDELAAFDGVEVTIRVSEKDNKKGGKKVKHRKLIGHEGLRLTKPTKHPKVTDSSTSYYSPPDRITPSQQNLIDTIMSHIHRKGLSSSLRMHIQNLLSMSRENINSLGISSSDTSITSFYLESIGTKQSVIKANTVAAQDEVQTTSKTPEKTEDLNSGKKDLQMEAARKTADIISQYSQLSEMLVKKIENLAKVGSSINESFKPNLETNVPDPDVSKHQVSTADSSYLYLPTEVVNPSLPVSKNVMEAFLSDNRYSQVTPTFNELPETSYFRPRYVVPHHSEMIPDQQDAPSVYYYPINSVQNAEVVYMPVNNDYFGQQSDMRFQHKEVDRRSMPPPTLSNGRFRYGVETSSPPHELTTIPEVDTPGTHYYSDSNSLSEQDEELVINVFEGLDTSVPQSEDNDLHYSENDSVKSPNDSNSSIQDIDVVSELMKRNILSSPFENKRKRKVMQAVQINKGQQNMFVSSSHQEPYYQMNLSSTGSSNANMGTKSVSGIHYNDLGNISLSPVQYVNYRVETVNNLENASSSKPDAKGVSVENGIYEGLIEVNSTKQSDAAMSHKSDKSVKLSKKSFKNNYNFPEGGDNVPLESLVEFSDIEEERLIKFNEILRDLDEAKEIMSDSSPEDLELIFRNLGIGWAGTTLRKTQEAQELNSGSTSGTSENVRKPPNHRVKERNVSSDRKSVEEHLTPPNVALRPPVILSASTDNLKKYKPRRKYNN